MFRDTARDLLRQALPAGRRPRRVDDGVRPRARASGRGSPSWASSASPCPRRWAGSGSTSSTSCSSSKRPAAPPRRSRCWRRPAPWAPRSSATPARRAPRHVAPARRLGRRGARGRPRTALRTSPSPARPSLLLLQHGDELHAVPRSAAVLTPQPSVDGARRLSSVAWSPSAATLFASGEAARGARGGRLRSRRARRRPPSCCGLARGMIDMTVDYVKVRHAVRQAHRQLPGREAPPGERARAARVRAPRRLPRGLLDGA